MRLGLIVFAFTISALSASVGYADTAGAPITVTATQIPLNPEDENQTQIADLYYRTGWRLESENEAFGGWSAMDLRRDRLTLFSDAGIWLTSKFDRSSEHPVDQAYIGSIASRNPEDPEKELVDLESVVRHGDQGYLAAFEQQHRVELLISAGGEMQPYPMPAEIFHGLSKNGGFEAMAKDSSGRLILFAEKGRDGDGYMFGWRVGRDDGAPKAEALKLALPKSFSPTALRLGSHGRFILVARAYSLLKGTRIKIMSFHESDIEAGGIITPTDHGTLKAPLNVDNFEALAVIKTDIEDQILILSDDNFSDRQATLLMMFGLPH